MASSSLLCRHAKDFPACNQPTLQAGFWNLKKEDGGGSMVMGLPTNGGFIMENTMKMNDLEVPHFRKPPSAR
jgi:hypothetical protein